MRALAAMLVVIYHVAYVSGSLSYGWAANFTLLFQIGVPIFFAISGFVLYRPMVAARHGSPRRSTAAYARSRALRILPAYWVALTLAAIYPSLSGVFTDDWWRYYGLLQAYASDTQFMGLGVAWSLCIEVTFYAALPLFALVMNRIAGTGPRWVRVELGVLAVLALASMVLYASWTILSILVTFAWFAVGMTAAVLSVAGVDDARALRRPGLLWALAGGACVLLCLATSPNDPAGLVGVIYGELGVEGVRSAYMVLSVVIVPLVLAPAIWGARGLPQRILSWRWLAWLGTVSYGIYLYHLPVLIAAEKLGLGDLIAGQIVVSYMIVALPATIALATASYYLIERPALSLRGMSRRRPRELPVEATAG